MKTYYFVRWGGLSAVKHKEYTKNSESMHIAPCLKGIYAFPKGTIEKFLIGGDYTKHHRQKLLVDGKPVLVNDCYDEDAELTKSFKKLLKKLNIKEKDLHCEYDEKLKEWIFTCFKKPRVFKHSGHVWSHLHSCIQKSDILATSGGWVKTTMPVYQKALKKSLMRDKFQTYLDFKIKGNPHTCPSCFAKDEYEVFLEHAK